MPVSEKSLKLLACAALVFCAGLAVQLPALSGRLLWDDAELIGANPFLGSCANLGAVLNPLNLARVLPVPMSARPVVNATLLADACAGAGPFDMKLTNALLHAFNAALLFIVLFAFTGSAGGALLGAAVLAVHPASVEAVNIIVFRSHLLGFFFFLCGLAAALLYVRGAGRAAAGGAAACYFLALLSVETAITLPAAALLAAYFEDGKAGLKKMLPLLGLFAAIALFYLWFRAPRSGYIISGVATPGIAGASALYPAALLPEGAFKTVGGIKLLPWRDIYFDRAANLFTMAGVCVAYLRDLVLPLNLSSEYNPAVIKGLRAGAWPLAGCLAFLAAGLGLLRGRRLAGLGLLFIAVTLLPALNIVPLYNIKADRYLYLPLAGLALTVAAAFGACRPGKARLAAGVAVACWLTFLAATTVRRAPEFADDLALFTAAVKSAPDLPRARGNLAAALLAAGDCAGAAREAGQAVKLNPAETELRLRSAYTLARCSRGGEALAEAQAALALSPEDPDALYLAGLLKLKTDRPRGVALLQRAAGRAPRRRDIRLTLSLAKKEKAGLLTKPDQASRAELERFYRQAGLFF